MAKKEKANQQEVKVKRGWWNNKTKGKKIYFIASMVVLALAIIFLITLLFARDIYNDAFADELYGEGVANGFEAIGIAFSGASHKLIQSAVVILLALLLSFLVSFLVRVFTIGASKRALTTGSIIKSLCRYAIIMVTIAILLTTWGVNVTGIVASLGVLTLIIGLGCQSLINDVISGLFIVFDDYFSVGDIVIIDGFRGYVEEVGLRAVKISDRIGNIKSINNSSITSVVNLSRQLNHISITMPASFNEDIERCEAVFARELPLIKERMPMIINGPVYKGVDSIDNGAIYFSFGFDTKAEFRFQSTRDFKREIYQMFVKNDILIPYRQITVNSPDSKDRPKASEEDKKLSMQLDKKNKARSGPMKKQRLSDKIAKAYIETVKTVEDDLKNN